MFFFNLWDTHRSHLRIHNPYLGVGVCFDVPVFDLLLRSVSSCKCALTFERIQHAGETDGTLGEI